MKLSEKMTAKAGRIRGHYLGTTHSSELLLEYAPEVAKLEDNYAEAVTDYHDIRRKLQVEKEALKKLAKTVCDEAAEPTEALWALRAALYEPLRADTKETNDERILLS